MSRLETALEDRIERLARRLGTLLTARHAALVTAESCTGGGVAEALTRVPGSSVWFDRGFVTYSNESKTDMLGVPSSIIESDGAVSEAVVLGMAQGAVERSGAMWAVALSGIAGPSGGSAEKPVGTVWIAWARRGGAAQAVQFRFGGDRTAVRRQSVCAAVDGLIARVESDIINMENQGTRG